MERELRCKGNKLHGLIVAPSTGIIEFRCSSRFCGKEPGVVVLHRFNLDTGDMETRRYSDPAKLKKEGEGGKPYASPSLRSP